MIKEKANDKIIPKKFCMVICKLFNSTILTTLYEHTAKRVGIDNKKEIFADSALSKVKNLAHVIVIPDLLTPGIKERICAKPI